MVDPNGKPCGPKWLVDRWGVDYFGRVVFVVNGSGITDRDLASVGRLARLQRLYLNGSSVSDAGLPYLKGLSRLDLLLLGHTRVTDAGVRELQRALPNVSIVR